MSGNTRRRSGSTLLSPQPHKIRVEPSNISFLEENEHSHLPSFTVLCLRTRRRMRLRPQLLVFVALVLFVGCTIFYLHTPLRFLGAEYPSADSSSKKSPITPSSAAPGTAALTIESPKLGNEHPIWQLVKNAEQEFEKVTTGQSKTLQEAVAEYRRRYGIPPPPNFDKWYEFAKARNVQLIDDYDSIHHSLTPFWGLKPKTIRNRAQEALGYDPNNLIGVLIRKGKIKKLDGGVAWHMEALRGMLQGFQKWLPDMDLCFNIHDEPRVMLQYDDLSRLVKSAREVKMPAANAAAKHRNEFSKAPSDLSDGSRFEDVKTTRFNVFAHQSTWTHSKMSCPPESPARTLGDGPVEDNTNSYALGELGFVYNKTAFSDICQSPSFSQTYGFFDRPNAFSLVTDLFPVFSASKPSSYCDIVYPSPWYWDGKVTYNDSADFEWTEKEDKFYWRGSTTGGFSRNGGWRRQHRQNIVKKINAGDQAKILIDRGEDGVEDWQVKQTPRTDFKELFDVHFSHIGQCDPEDCEAQKTFFDIKDKAEQKDAWKYKYLLDMDGNAFSGRFYAFLKSRSLVYKMAVFREWHEEWLKPWVHYIPLSLRGDEWVEAVRWFAGEPSGKKAAERIAMQGREWSNKVLRNDDFEVYFFRLLLEYGRLVDDNRETIGYTG
ncbi:capsule associated protein [Diplocarpon rosae]|nr:capsule associated protein [Diplocarpon rosae]